MPHLKIADVNDIPDLLRMSHDFYKISPYSKYPLNSQKVERLIESFIMGSKTTYMPLILYTDHPVGIIAGIAGDLPLSDVRFVEELIWWIDPEHRGLGSAMKMLSAFEYWAKEKAHGAFIKLSYIDDMKSQALEKMYRRRGYFPLETGYIKEF